MKNRPPHAQGAGRAVLLEPLIPSGVIAAQANMDTHARTHARTHDDTQS